MATRKTPKEKLAELEKQERQIKARMQRERAKISSNKRKQDTRRKIIAGALALEHAEVNPTFGKEMRQLIQKHVTREQDRKLFGLEAVQGG